MGSERRGRWARVALVAGLLTAVPSSARADWIASAYLGHVWTRSSTVTLTLPERGTALEIQGVDYRAESFTSPQYYGYRVAWVPSGARWIGLEAEVIHAKVYAETDRSVRFSGTRDGAPFDGTFPMSTVVRRLAMSHGLNFILANVAVRRELGPLDADGLPRVAVVARVGAGPTVPHSESTVENANVDHYESGGLGVQLAGGIEAAVWRRLRILAEYKFTWAEPEIDVAGGQATIPSHSHHLVGGLGYRF